MQITYIYLRGFKRLNLNNIEEVEINVVEQLNLLSGSNGCGKSTLLKEATPFPASPGDYRDNGLKIIEVNHNNHHYRLISKLEKGGKHTFIKDGVAIHKDVTATVQRELVIKEFNYTPLVHRLMVGDIRFTSLLPNARKDILIMVSKLDLDWGIKLHLLIKDQIRDNLAVLKHLHNKNSDAKHRLRALHIPADLDKQRQDAEDQLSKLIPFASQNLPNIRMVLKEIDSAYTSLMGLKNTLSKFDNLRVPIDGISSIDDLNFFIGSCTSEKCTSQNKISVLTKEAEALSTITESISSNDLTKEDLILKVNQLTELKNLKEETFYVNVCHEEAIKALIEFSHTISGIHSDAIELQDFNLDEITSIWEKDSNLKREYAALTQRLESYNVNLNHLLDTSAIVTCPKCRYDFNIKGITVESKIASLRSDIKVAEQTLHQLSIDLENHNLKVDNVRLYKSLQYRIRELQQHPRIPRKFWQEFNSEKEELLWNSSKVNNVVVNWISNTQRALEYEQLLKDLKNAEAGLTVFEKYGSNINSKLSWTHEEISRELEVLHRYEEQSEVALKVLSKINHFTKVDTEANMLLAGLNDRFELMTKVLIRDDAKTRSDDLYAKLASNTNIIQQRDNLLNSIAETEAEYTNLFNKQKVLIILEEQLSPTKGIIADQMFGFLNSFLEQVNQILDELWTSRLNVSVCNMDNGSLDYKFPLHVGLESIPNTDISVASEGQLEVIDLAFLLVIRSYLNLSDYPLYLDETGANFSAIHRSNLMSYLKSILNNRLCSQIFLVNHYSSFLNGLTNMDTIDLDRGGIDAVSKNYTITYRG